MDYALELNDVTKHYDGFSLDHVSIALPAGSIMGFVGENGAGKSTTIKLIMDLIKRDNGSIKIFNQDNKSLSDLTKEDIGVVMDECCFPEILTIDKINKFLAKIYTNWDTNTFMNYVEQFHLPMKKSVKDLSKGMKMKLNIACALSHKAKLLILDEATSGLDPVVRDEILDIFLDFIQDDSHSIFMSSHITSDLEKICDYICLIHKGKIMFTKTKDELMNEYGIAKCSIEDLKTLPKSAVIGYRKNQFGVEALVKKHEIRGGYILDPATIEDIMLFYVRGMHI